MMGNEERNQKIENFIKKWDEVMKAADEISDFRFDFKVTVASNDSLTRDRIKLIDGVNEIFTKHNRRFISSNYYLKDQCRTGTSLFFFAFKTWSYMNEFSLEQKERRTIMEYFKDFLRGFIKLIGAVIVTILGVWLIKMLVNSIKNR